MAEVSGRGAGLDPLVTVDSLERFFFFFDRLERIIYLFIYLFIYLGCVGSSFLCEGFL